MSVTAFVALVFVHFVYAVRNACHAFFIRFVRPPLPLRAKRRKLPAHLALILTCDDHTRLGDAEQIFLNTLLDVTDWCRALGIQRLSAYDERGILQGLHDDLVEYLDANDETDGFVYTKHSDNSASDTSGSRSLTPDTLSPQANLGVTTLHLPPPPSLETSRRNPAIPSRPLTIHLLSNASSTSAIVSVSRAYAASQPLAEFDPTKPSDFHVSVPELEAALEGDAGFPAPDLMIVHDCSPAVRARAPLELHGFPPWQVRLTEIYHNEYPPTQWRWLLPWRRGRTVRLDERKFRRALDEFAGAEMRVGK